MAEIIHAKDIRPGMTFLDKGNIYLVIENTFNKTCQAKAVIKVRVRNLRKGGVSWETLDQDKYEKAEISSNTMTFSYKEGDNYAFMDDVTYETVEIPASKLEWEKQFIIEGLQVRIQKFGDEILGVSLPESVELIVKETEDAAKNSGATARMKKAVLENGVTIDVPEFIKQGEKVIIKTIDGSYAGRGKQ
ncbi:MAG: elongation factor P [Mycoplasmoidaceae bacterium]|nr:MAG: elongation factor P [Mycoplasmoidaceae bacterium]